MRDFLGDVLQKILSWESCFSQSPWLGSPHCEIATFLPTASRARTRMTYFERDSRLHLGGVNNLLGARALSTAVLFWQPGPISAHLWRGAALCPLSQILWERCEQRRPEGEMGFVHGPGCSTESGFSFALCRVQLPGPWG